MKGNATMLKAEALLRFALYTSPDRKNATPIGLDSWVDRQTALGDTFRLNSEHKLTFLDEGYESGRYVVAMLPLIRRVPDPRGGDARVLHVTVYLAKAAELPLFSPVDSFTLDDVRQSMLCLDAD